MRKRYEAGRLPGLNWNTIVPSLAMIGFCGGVSSPPSSELTTATVPARIGRKWSVTVTCCPAGIDYPMMAFTNLALAGSQLNDHLHRLLWLRCARRGDRCLRFYQRADANERRQESRKKKRSNHG